MCSTSFNQVKGEKKFNFIRDGKREKRFLGFMMRSYNFGIERGNFAYGLRAKEMKNMILGINLVNEQ